jgi:hypothetical protein
VGAGVLVSSGFKGSRAPVELGPVAKKIDPITRVLLESESQAEVRVTEPIEFSEI